MAAGLRMSTSVLVDLALEDFFLGVFGLPVFLAGRELWDLDFLILVGFEENTRGLDHLGSSTLTKLIGPDNCDGLSTLQLLTFIKNTLFSYLLKLTSS